MNLLLEELTMGVPDAREFARVVIRLLGASLLGAIVGFERERVGKSAGLRTHMLVALGSAVFVAGCEKHGMSDEGLSRVVQGIATGIGFIGAGAILKTRDDRQIFGLTTAAGIWLTSAVGIVVGLGGLGLGIISVIFALVILRLLIRAEKRMHGPGEHSSGT